METKTKLQTYEAVDDCNTLLYIFLEDLREYMRESGNNIGYDDRDSTEFIKIFNENHPNLIMSKKINWDIFINELSQWLENEFNKKFNSQLWLKVGIKKDDFFDMVISYIEQKHPDLFQKQ